LFAPNFFLRSRQYHYCSIFNLSTLLWARDPTHYHLFYLQWYYYLFHFDLPACTLMRIIDKIKSTPKVLFTLALKLVSYKTPYCLWFHDYLLLMTTSEDIPTFSHFCFYYPYFSIMISFHLCKQKVDC
jgi:hypothetical protein